MIYAITKPFETYQVMGTHLQTIFRDDADYFAVFCLFVPCIFDFEVEGKPEKYMPQFLVWDERIEKSLDCQIGDTTLRGCVRNLTPVETYFKLEKYSKHLEKLPILDLFAPIRQNTPLINSLSMVASRATAWALSYNAAIEQTGSVFQQTKIELPRQFVEFCEMMQQVANERVLK